MADLLQRAVECLSRSGCLIYPTETFYALGAGAFDEQACARLLRLKSGRQGKPFPLIIGSLEQLSLVTSWEDATLRRLIERFWPGPLSVLVPSRQTLAPQTRSQEGWSSLRLSPHPLAQRLCLGAGCPVVATSANRSGCQPPAAPEAVDQRLLEGVDCFVSDPPFPRGGQPSTLVSVVGEAAVSILRAGAVSRAALEQAGLRVLSDCPADGA